MLDGVTFGQRPKLPGDLLLAAEGGLAGVGAAYECDVAAAELAYTSR